MGKAAPWRASAGTPRLGGLAKEPLVEEGAHTLVLSTSPLLQAASGQGGSEGKEARAWAQGLLNKELVKGKCVNGGLNK